ncbi:acetyl-CoA carboxylase [Meira miltonrushii]|uniref:Acetyl-CoA carboxylase n=1 Tax=Meira miltonrushii TaxID=1280837 RepID=A0A316VFJ4_9BASI|nr:acetyl-CoA carboxylase [Meira miltonrushii]PWN34245.1 acetyl-CoA carboxylase [Meira miltonrushii]
MTTTPPTTMVSHKKVQHFIGGNSLDTAASSSVADFVRRNGGHTVITRILLCTNGIAAVKEIRSIRKWSYETFGNERAITFVAMATPEDLKVNAEYVRLADEWVEVPGGTNNNNFANVDLIVDIAERTGVHAVWAGWGHASENPRLPEQLRASKQKIVFIGPPGSAMRSLGDKISSTIVAQHADVPCMPWSGTGVKDTIMSDEGFLTVSDEVYQKACIHTSEEGLERAQTIGFPVMIKASEGGGGKGIRMCGNAEDFRQLYNAVLGEVPGSPVFVMKLAGKARHLEVQLMADQYGNAISIFGRDCSVQRRHQKIIEEAPITIAPEDAREAMEKAAVRLAKLVGYVSAGTVEWLYSPESGEYHFLELNPRLQVEHPTTEMVSGVNIPAAQLQVAMGLPLYCIRDIRTLYGMDPKGTEPIDFDFKDPASLQTQRKPQPKGHVIACRITSENPETGFKPGMGALTDLNFRSSTSTWGYFSVSQSGALHEFADSQFGHVFAYGLSREEARQNMVVSLKELNIRGDFRTIVEYLIMLLEKPAFESNQISTAWLDGLIKDRVSSDKPPLEVAVLCGAVVKAHLRWQECEALYMSILHKGQVPPRDTLRTTFSDITFTMDGVKFTVTCSRSSAAGWTIYLNGGRHQVATRSLSDGGMLISISGRSHPTYWREEGGGSSLRLMVDSKTALLEDETDPSQIRSPSPGKLVSLLVSSGSHVTAGQPIAELEVMKMYMPLTSQESGIVNFLMSPGTPVNAGDILAILSLDDPSKVQRAKPFDRQLPDSGSPVIIGSKSHQRFAYVLSVLSDILDGFDQSVLMQACLNELLDLLHNVELPYGEALHVLSSLSGRIPSRLEELIRTSIDSSHGKGLEFPAARLRKVTDNYIRDSADKAIQGQVQTTVAPLMHIFDEYAPGLRQHGANVLAGLLQRYADVEGQFSGEADVVLKLRQEADSLDKVVALQLSHNGVLLKNALVISLLDKVVKQAAIWVRGTADSKISRALNGLAALEGKSTAPVALKAREVSLARDLPSLDDRKLQMESILKTSIMSSSYGGDREYHEPDFNTLRELSDSQYTVYDVLHTFFGASQPHLAYAALVTYVLRAYRAYEIVDFEYATEDYDDEERAVLTWQFQVLPAGRPQTERQVSESDLATMKAASDANAFGHSTNGHGINGGAAAELRQGTMTSCATFDDLNEVIPRTLRYFKSRLNAPTNVLNIAVTNEAKTTDVEARALFIKAANTFASEFDAACISRVTFLHCQPGVYPWFTTLRRSQDGGQWAEEKFIRNIEPALAYQLELERMTTNFDVTPVPISSSTIHLYFARGIANPADTRFFVRSLVRPGRIDTANQAEYIISASDRIVNDILNVLEVAMGQAEYRNADASHIFMSFIYQLEITIEDVQRALAGFIDRHGLRLFRLRVTAAEIRLIVRGKDGERMPMRAFITNETGLVVRYEAYQELPGEDGEILLSNIAGPSAPAPLHMQPANQPYSTKVALQSRRSRAHALQTTFAYDFIDVLRQSLRAKWKRTSLKHPSDPIKSHFELVLDDNQQLRQVQRAPGMNKIGMVAWLIEVLTPEYPNGRPLIIIANDVTIQAGSFGPAEDAFFAAASRMARQLGIPRLYVSANSGARIGLATEVMDLFKVKFVDDDAVKGFEYLYLDNEGLEQLNRTAPDSVRTQKKTNGDGSVHHVLTDIIGASQDGLGVECLSGSGLIAGETSRAKEEIFTATIVTGRSVGIGAYLARLGERVIQVEGSPMILTGYQALNKLLGREVYTSNLQLGGPQIMYRNGVSHITVKDDLSAMTSFVKWLSFVPSKKSLDLPRFLPTVGADTWDRSVDYVPPTGAYDPRFLIEGQTDAETNKHISGLFDNGSFQETLAGWATSVVVGRARLGGIPIGIIAVETRTLERVVPADPANPNSQEQRIMEAGQVWYPNSAYKTAQAILDFNREGLPLMILANWRGFSGGQEDMFQQVLKYGSMIVDGLVQYKQPVFVYLPPKAELRGGAWVVVDRTINDNGLMEMYADPTSRGGVLEPEGIVSVKYRQDKQRETMNRLDQEYAKLSAQAKSANASNEARKALAQREKQIAPIFSAVATAYADLHDKTGRMTAVGVIREAVPWKEARRYFYQRLNRKLLEEGCLKTLRSASSIYSSDTQLARNALEDALGVGLDDVDDATMIKTLEDANGKFAQRFNGLVKQAKSQEVIRLASTLDADTRRALLASLQV